MKTAYELYTKTGQRISYSPAETLYDAAQGAATAAGYPDLGLWTVRDGDGFSLDASDAWFLISEKKIAENDAEKVQLALEMALQFAGYDGEHHKTWVIDQVVRILAGDGYKQAIAEWRDGEDGPDTYEWDEGIAP